MKSHGKRVEDVSSISFNLLRFELPEKREQLLIESTEREQDIQKCRKKDDASWPKYVVNVENTHLVDVHWVIAEKEKTVNIHAPISQGIFHHYRDSYRDDIQANTTDHSMLSFVPEIRDALKKRFHEDPTTFLMNLESVHNDPDPIQSIPGRGG